MQVKGRNKKKTQILMKDNKQKISTLFFIRTILKEQWDLLENKNRIRTIKAEVNTKKLFIQVWKTEIYCN